MITTLRPAADASAELEIKRSRFLAHLARTPDEAAARDFITTIKQRYPDARHHCSAFVVVVPGQHDAEHSSDDGEPSGTAGRPMLDVLRGAGGEGEGLGECCVVVVRYFGGVLLGTGGLVRAYGDATREVLRGLPLVRVAPRELLEVEAEHGDAGALEHGLSQFGWAPVERHYASRTTQLVLAVNDVQGALARIAELSGGRVKVRDLGASQVEVPAGRLPG
ncbi:IMPACT family protein [Propionibacteriaceae bacterium G1746]